MAQIRTDHDDQLRAIIRDAIEAKGTNPYRVARDAGLHDDQLRGWLSGRRAMIRSDLLGRVMDTLGVHVQAGE